MSDGLIKTSRRLRTLAILSCPKRERPLNLHSVSLGQEEAAHAISPLDQATRLDFASGSCSVRNWTLKKQRSKCQQLRPPRPRPLLTWPSLADSSTPETNSERSGGEVENIIQPNGRVQDGCGDNAISLASPSVVRSGGGGVSSFPRLGLKEPAILRGTANLSDNSH